MIRQTVVQPILVDSGQFKTRAKVEGYSTKLPVLRYDGAKVFYRYERTAQRLRWFQSKGQCLLLSQPPVVRNIVAKHIVHDLFDRCAHIDTHWVLRRKNSRTASATAKRCTLLEGGRQVLIPLR